MFSLTTTHLRFTCEATTPLRLEVESFRAGSNLRGALGQVMTRTYCAHPPLPVTPPLLGEGTQVVADSFKERFSRTQDMRRLAEGERSVTCPVCWLLAANEKPGQERRGYALVPPASEPASRGLEAGERFEFGLTLFGSALQFLPYFVLAVPEMGRLGIGPGRGKFTLRSLWAVNPFTHARECLLAEGDNLVHSPTLTVNHAQVLGTAERLAAMCGERIQVEFVTPTRLIEDGALSKTPDFAVLFARLLKRLDELEEQHGGGNRRGRDEVESLHDLAKRVRLIETQTRWIEVWSGSTRRGEPSPMSGFVGHAVYAASPEVWRLLLPWLVWGQLVQVGKDTVKGNGVVEIVV